MAYQVEFLPSARRDFKRLPKPAQIRLANELRALVDDPRAAGVVKLPGDENAWRIRVGDYRVLYEIHDQRLLVLVIRVGHRKDVYRKGG
jgi:mRNA interferase RelE/StbE